MPMLDRLGRWLSGRQNPPGRSAREGRAVYQRSSYEGASGRMPRAAAFPSFGSHGPETLAAAPTLRSRARHGYANNGHIRGAADAIVAETDGAAITATSAHPDPEAAARIDKRFAEAAAQIDAEGR